MHGVPTSRCRMTNPALDSQKPRTFASQASWRLGKSGAVGEQWRLAWRCNRSSRRQAPQEEAGTLGNACREEDISQRSGTARRCLLSRLAWKSSNRFFKPKLLHHEVSCRAWWVVQHNWTGSSRTLPSTGSGNGVLSTCGKDGWITSSSQQRHGTWKFFIGFGSEYLVEKNRVVSMESACLGSPSFALFSLTSISDGTIYMFRI